MRVNVRLIERDTIPRFSVNATTGAKPQTGIVQFDPTKKYHIFTIDEGESKTTDFKLPSAEIKTKNGVVRVKLKQYQNTTYNYEVEFEKQLTNEVKNDKTKPTGANTSDNQGNLNTKL